MEPKLFSKDLTEDNLNCVIDSEFSKNTYCGHHVSSFDNFISTGINQILTHLFIVKKTFHNDRIKTEEDRKIDIIDFEVKFSNVNTSKPSYRSAKSGIIKPLMPNMARKHNLNYCAPITIDADITATAYLKDSTEPIIRTDKIKGFQIASIPIMVGSRSCNLYEITKEAKKSLEEDVNDLGSYFIIKGGEWSIAMTESRLFNSPHIFKNVGHEKEIARLEFISKPGDAYENSSELIMKYVTNGNIYICFTSNPYLKLLEIPFHIVFKLLGMTSDKEIIDNIIYGYSTRENTDKTSERMFQILKKAFVANDAEFNDALLITDQASLLNYFSDKIAKLYQSKAVADENLVKYLDANILKLIDKNALPHIGLAADSRHDKLRYLGHLIHELLLVEAEIVPSTDRDSLSEKRLVAAGRAYAKVLKKEFNLAVVQAIKKKLTKDFKSMPFSQVPLAQSVKSVSGPDLEKALIKAIVTGSKIVATTGKKVPNGPSSEMLHRKNQTNVISTAGVIRTPNTSASKQDQRSDEMRRVHPSYDGYIDPSQSADTGEQVGMVKQKTISSSLTEASSSEILKEILLNDPDIIPLIKIFPEHIHKFNLTKIMVNGYWIGCCSDSPKIIQKYKEMRRGFKFELGKYKHIGNSNYLDSIDSKTTIHWDTDRNKISFWVDAGRIIRPMLVVRNNGELDSIGRELFGTNYDPISNTGFIQDILLTKDDVKSLMKKGITVDNLHERGIIDYIAPEELENCYVASSLDVLKNNQFNPLHQYTHCEIPISIFGIPTLTCPYAGHNQPPRITFQTNQVKQTCGWFSLNWPYTVHKHSFLQFYCEMPIMKTVANKYVYPNGRNAVVAIGCFGGFNQEDSILYNKSSMERGSFKGLAFNFTKVILEKDELFGNPNESSTIIEKKYANFGKIVDGYPSKGTILLKDDIMIGKMAELPKPQGNKTHKDTSIAYTGSEPAMVEMVIKDVRNQDDEKFCTVKYSCLRPVEIGNKFSSRSGQKAMTGMGYTQWDMPFSDKSIVPSLILNPHAIPSRMTINQLIESEAAKLAALKGCYGDATVFRKIDLKSIGDELETFGYNRYGTEHFYDGRTGEAVDREIFVGPTYYQRLQKFATEEVYSISTGPTCAITRQPLDGKSNKGGLRIGEMEKDVIMSHGAGYFMMEKFRDDSDGFDIYVCRTCGKRPVVNEDENIAFCNTCQSVKMDSDIVKVKSTWSTSLFLNELESANIGVSLGIEPFEYES